MARGALALPEPMSPQQWLNLLNRLGTRGRRSGTCGSWSAIATGQGGDLSGTVSAGWPHQKRAPRGLGWRPRHLHPRARQEEAEAGPASAQRITLPVADLQRWLLHVPVPQTRVVRCYGLYHQTHTEALAVCRTALGQAPRRSP